MFFASLVDPQFSPSFGHKQHTNLCVCSGSDDAQIPWEVQQIDIKCSHNLGNLCGGVFGVICCCVVMIATCIGGVFSNLLKNLFPQD